MSDTTIVTELNVHKYNLMDLHTKKFLAIVAGGRQCGKSTLIRELIEQCTAPKYAKVVVFSISEDSREFYRDLVPSDCIHTKMDMPAIKAVVDTQKNTERHIGSLLLVVDDDGSNTEWRNSTVFRECALNGRFYNISLIISSQYFPEIPRAVLHNADIGFWFKHPVQYHNRLCDTFFRGFVNSHKAFTKVYDECTTDHECLVSTSEDMFYFRASDKTAMKRTEERLDVYREELTSVCWHPTRLIKGCGETFEEEYDIWELIDLSVDTSKQKRWLGSFDTKIKTK